MFLAPLCGGLWLLAVSPGLWPGALPAALLLALAGCIMWDDIQRGLERKR